MTECDTPGVDGRVTPELPLRGPRLRLPDARALPAVSKTPSAHRPPVWHPSVCLGDISSERLSPLPPPLFWVIESFFTSFTQPCVTFLKKWK